ncbi:hypothetical protein OAP56_03965, partial [Rickettsiaceae bacterium]|nr:hypothetical protein [Rickettsiaceae bacterium]
MRRSEALLVLPHKNLASPVNLGIPCNFLKPVIIGKFEYYYTKKSSRPVSSRKFAARIVQELYGISVSVIFSALYDSAKSLVPRLYGRIARNSSLFLA